MKNNSFLILVSKNILKDDKDWHILEVIHTVMEWGDATVFLLKKTLLEN